MANAAGAGRRERSLALTDDNLRAYSRRGNFHADADEAAALGLPGLVAQGMQVAGPAYGMLLDAWGDEFLARGVLELKFVGMVTAGETVDALVTIEDDGEHATLGVTRRNDGDDAPVVVALGRARRVGDAPG